VTDKRYCVVDVCGTLFTEDTTLGLIRTHVTRTGNTFRRILLWLLTVRFSPFYLAFVLLERVSRKHIFKHAIIRFLGGSTVQELEFSAERYIDHLMACDKQAEVWSRLKLCEGEVLVLASASLEPLVAALASRLGCLYVASKLECNADRYSGRLLMDVTGKKIDFLSACIKGFSLGEVSTVVSDNLTDEPLLSLADKPVVVLNRSKDRLRWKGLEAEYLEVWR
jgi:phosphoserine phosphatase